MKIGELAQRSGLTAHTLRYYEKIGLLSYASRDAGGQRRYDDSVLLWLGFIGRLKASGMPLQTILQYAALREAGPATEAQRLQLLSEHRLQVQARLAQLQDCLQMLDQKILGYTNSKQRMPLYDQALPLRQQRPPPKRPAKAG
ncbi:MerR family transcriptional regulator [Pseudoduganella danionis]|uniref:MerR family transcriptional regulator n=1 Tax=Pseudoduganella danionis TaxID=1890295 RepID=A0ABW9SKX4_9BURK|nr:MerR family transcriptional regulator [Pseudoduganella danionis]MTW31374.1 MerR family transcriptional regulator [Pseudoduganella danionis]